MKNVVFIINPIAGKGDGRKVGEKIEKKLVGWDRDFEIKYTERPGHGGEIASEAASKGAYAVIAVGGDGTVNEIASSLVGTDTALGIIPRGSGNGLAYHLGIPKNLDKALSVIRNPKVLTIDTATFNGHPFFCTAGVGYDAKVAMEYANSGSRGLVTYARKVMSVWHDYQPQEYHISTENADFVVKAFLVTIGNANQWGNHFHITPKASISDGLLDITIIHPVSLAQALPLPLQMMDKHILNNHHVDSLLARNVRIQRNGPDKQAHYDGEALNIEGDIDIRIVPSSLNVLSDITEP